jgi:hypothetical protein
MLSLDGVDQYADAGENHNVNTATEYNQSWSFSLFVQINRHINEVAHIFTNWQEDYAPGSYNGFSLYNQKTDTIDRLVIIYGDREAGKNRRIIFETSKSLDLGKLYHVAFSYDQPTNTGTFYINGMEVGTSHSGGAPIASIYGQTTNPLRIARVGANEYGDIAISHLTFFNRTLTAEEISYIHAQGGLLPASTHAACVAHYPCTQREGATLWDVVEQYNYAKATALVLYHASLINFSAAQHTGDAQTAYKEFYSKTDLRPYVDSNSDGTPDSPLIEKASLLPPLRKALRFQSSAAQTMQCGNLGSIQGIRLAVKLDTINQSLLSLQNTAATAFQVASGSITAGASITNLQIYIDRVAQNAADAGAILNDLKLHDVVLLFDTVSGTDFRITAGDKTVAALFVMSEKISRKQIIKLANNTLIAQPASNQQDGITQLYNLNEITDNAGTYEVSNEIGASNAVLSGYTAANIDPADPSYVLTDINDLR